VPVVNAHTVNARSINGRTYNAHSNHEPAHSHHGTYHAGEQVTNARSQEGHAAKRRCQHGQQRSQCAESTSLNTASQKHSYLPISGSEIAHRWPGDAAQEQYHQHQRVHRARHPCRKVTALRHEHKT
jgi:hypothetical protein